MFGLAFIPGFDFYEVLLFVLEYTPYLLALNVIALFMVKKSCRVIVGLALPLTYVLMISGAVLGSWEDAARRGYDPKMPSVRVALEQYIESGDCANLLPGTASEHCVVGILEANKFAPTFGTHEIMYMLKDLVIHSVLHLDSHNEGNIKEGYNKGDHWFENTLGKDVMVYTSGIYKNGDESLKVAQEYKLDYVANAIELKKGDKVLDIGCGWGRLIQHFRDNYDAEVTGITLSSGQKAWAEKNVGVNKGPGTGVIMLQDGMKMYDDHHTNFDIVPEGGFDKITSLEMAEHVGIRRYNEFLTKVHELLKDDGVFYFQVAGLRRHWRYEDLIWGMFMGEHVFPGADASCSIGWVSTQLERAGFEIQRVSNLGSHYSKTLDQWLDNWRAAKEKTIELAGAAAYRRWEVFLAWSVRVARQGSSTVFMFTVTKAGGKKTMTPALAAVREARRIQTQAHIVPTWETPAATTTTSE